MGVKSVLGRVIFRKVNGRIVPIRIHNVADKIAEASTWSKHRKIIAKLPNGEQIAQLNLRLPDKGKSAELLSVAVEKKFRKKDISKNLFARAKQFLERAGYKFLRSSDIQHVAQVKIRKRAGRYVIPKADGTGKLNRSRTRFFADQFGMYGEEKRRVISDEAIRILKENQTPQGKGRQITATTMLKKFRGKK